jgi:hypothetical protein
MPNAPEPSGRFLAAGGVMRAPQMLHGRARRFSLF